MSFYAYKQQPKEEKQLQVQKSIKYEGKRQAIVS
jgi:hypothetical protein